MRPHLAPEEDGWFEWRDGPRRPTRVYVQVAEGADGRFQVSALLLDGPVSAEVLRAVPVGRIEATANAQLHGSGGESGGPARRRRANTRIAARLRSNAAQGYSEAFYDAVAASYRDLVGTSSRPIVELAEANDVPVTTAQRWVREARRRGKLPPGRSGKAG